MLVKELEKYLLSECANCSCHINPFDKVNTLELCDRNKIFGNANSNFEALSYIYEIPSDKLTVNFKSHYAISEDFLPSDENDPLTLPININLTLCKICSPVFGEVYRAHTKLKQIAAKNNFISKSIHHNDLQTKLNNTNVKNLAEQEITLEEFKVEIDEETENKTECKFTVPEINEVEKQITIQPSESEINETENKDTIECNEPKIYEDEKEDCEHSLEYSDPKFDEDEKEDSLEYSEPETEDDEKQDSCEYSEPEIDEDEINYQFSDEANSDNDPIGTGAGDIDSSDELQEDDTTDVQSEKEMSVTSVPDYTFDFDSMEQESVSVSDSPSNSNDVKPIQSRRKQILGRLNNEVDELLTYNSLIKGPPYNCPTTTCNLIYKNRTALTTHCKLNHKLLIHPTCFANVESLNERNMPREGFATNMKIRLGSEKSDIELSIHDAVIKGPPFNCPKCVQSYSSNSTLATHCKDVHRLLLPTLRSKEFSCSKCKCGFDTVGSLHLHCRSQHKTDFFCRLCHSCFTTNDKLFLHLKTSCKLIFKANVSLSADSVDQANSEESSGLESYENRDAQQTPIHPNVNNCTMKGGRKLKSSTKSSNRSKSKNVKDGLSSSEVGKVIIYTLNEGTSPPFKCLKCDESFDSVVLLIKHSLKVHKVILSINIKNTLPKVRRQNYFCDECNETVHANMEEFKTHLKTFHFERFVSCERKTKFTDPPTSSSSESLACRECGMGFGDFDSLKNHNLEIHSITLEDAKDYFFPFICRRCDKHFETTGKLTHHLLQVHKTLKPLLDCKYCTETFYSGELLSAHMRLMHNIQLKTYNQKLSAVRCAVCSKIFQSRTDLIFHKMLRSEKSNDNIPSNESGKSGVIPSANVNENKTKLTCQICNVQFETVDELRKHQTDSHAKHIENSSTGPFVCHLCDKKFASKYYLYSHLRIVHLNMKKNKKTCKICGEPVPLGVTMPEHVKTAHIQERLFKCQICDKAFKNLYALNQHKASHSEVLSFTCISCGKRFKTRNTIRRHEKICLNSEKKFGCDKCTAVFKTERSLQRHLEDHNYKEIGAQLKCEKCDEVFSCPSKLKYHNMHSHSKAGPVPCPICGKVFTLQNRVNFHMRTVHRDKK